MNRLQFETSPYLKQHAHNPVDWYTWSEEAFNIAKKENKPVLVSIGYSACHWCHVMERESFEDADIAAFMNKNFVNIKVDREERPDVDHLYMDALQVLTGQGGWPLNMFVTPDRLPFFGGTYFPPKRIYQRASWMEVLEAVKLSWEKKSEEVLHQSEQIIKHLAQVNIQETGTDELPFSKQDFAQIVGQLLAQADDVFGGFGAAPKFPQTMSLQFLLHYYIASEDFKALDYAMFSLDKMLAGGIYDQIGGGLARYSTDSEWLVPHFEKMLYDNALFLEVLADAYSISKKEHYKKAILETINFCNRELTENKDGIGFYAALDADSEGVEGKFYVWTKAEIISVLPNINKLILDYWDVTEDGNWEDQVILNYSHVNDRWFLKNEVDQKVFSEELEVVKKHLFEVREKRERPRTDTKILLSWNALMINALVKCAIVLNDENLLYQAQQNADFLISNFCIENQWYRNFGSPDNRIVATLEDLAFLVKSLLSLGEATQNYSYISLASEVQDYIEDHFSDEQNHFYYYSNKNVKDIVLRKVETYDGAIPSVNAVMAENNLLLSKWMENVTLEHRAEKMLKAQYAKAKRYPSSFGYWCKVLLRNAKQCTLVLSTNNTTSKVLDIQSGGLYDPSLIVAINTPFTTKSIPLVQKQLQTTEDEYYYCSKFICYAPENDLSALSLKIKIEKMLD